MKPVRSRRAWMALLLAFALPFALVACGDEQAETTAQDEEPEPTSTPTEEAATETIDVVAEEYTFKGLPEKLAPGSYEFQLTNEGKEPHELALFRLKTDTPVPELIKLPQKQAEKQIEPVGFTFAKPGEDAKDPVVGELEAGEYAAVCFVPVKGNGPPHAFKGMVHEMTVE